MTLDQIQRVLDAADAPYHVKVYLAGGRTIVGQLAGSFDDGVLGITTHSGPARSNRIKNITTRLARIYHCTRTRRFRAPSGWRSSSGLGSGNSNQCRVGRGPCQRVRRIVCLYESCPRSVATTCAAPARWRKLLAIADEVIE
jgi:hypothetical protein